MTIDQSQTFTAVVSGSSGTYTSYQWYVNAAIQSAATGSTFSFTSSSAGSYAITVVVTDSLGNS